MNYSGAHFQKIFLKDFITTELNERGEEKKNLVKLLPDNWNTEDFDYSQPDIKNKNRGYVIKTGRLNKICVLDFDDLSVYKSACELVSDLHRYYTVETRRGYHVYFEYDESLVKSKIPKIDLQTNNKLVIGPDTLIKRFNGTQFKYSYVYGKIEKMPRELRDWCCNVKEGTRQRKDFETSINYNYEATDDECREILDQMAEKHREYFTEYSSWITFTAVMNTLDKQELWDEYSERYSENNYNKYKNMSIWKSIKTKISINFFCKLLNIPALKYHKEVPEDELWNEIEYYEETTKWVDMKFVNVSYQDFKKKDTIIIESGTGTGKTTCVSRLFKRLKQEEERCSILSIVNLISLANQQKLTFGKNGVKLHMYNDEKVNPAIIISHDACICVNSLWKLSECNFKNKIVYIDEIYALCMALTHNETLHKQRQIFNTLYRIITTCKKLIVSDAHIHNNVMQLLNPRLFQEGKTYVHYINEFQKFHGTPAVRYNDENEFYSVLEKKVLDGESFSFGSDSKSIIEKWYSKLFASASVKTQSKMLLYTSEAETEIQEDWNDKIIFYSPKITPGVDITCINSSEQFMYITGQSVSSINLLQMSTRTRNMNQLSYYSSARSCESLYESYEECVDKLSEKYLANQIGFSKDDIEDYVMEPKNWQQAELIHLHMFVRNSYALDIHNTNVLYFFEQELKNCGISFQQAIGARARMDKAVVMEFKAQTQKIRDDKYKLLLESFEKPETILPESLKAMKKRCELLNLTKAEDVNEYRELIEDNTVLDHFFNYNGLKKSFEHCESEVRDTVNSKMIAGVEKTRWFKIKYVHMLAKVCGIDKNLFGIEEIQMPELTAKNKNLIDSIKKLYGKRDKLQTDEYDLDSIKQLYKFMLNSLTKKLKLISSIKNKSRGEERDKVTYQLNEEVIDKYDNLIQIMNPQTKQTQAEYMFNFDKEEE